MAVNTVLTKLDLRENRLMTKGFRKIGQALQVNRSRARLEIDYDPWLGREIQRLLVVNKTLDT